MIEWFKSLPKTMFVTIVLTAGVLFIVISDPPRTVCDSQLDKFKEATSELLALDSVKRPTQKVNRFRKLLDTCKSTNSAGGCYELFLSVKRMLKVTQTISPECYGKLSSHEAFSSSLWQTLDLMVQLAWGAKPPQTSSLKGGWFDPADLNLYCEMKRAGENIYSASRWSSFVEGYFKSLPGASALSRDEAWSKMLFSINCSAYM